MKVETQCVDFPSRIIIDGEVYISKKNMEDLNLDFRMGEYRSLFELDREHMFESLPKTGSEFGSVDFDSLLFDDDFKGISAELFLLAAAHILLLYGVVVTTWAEKKYPILLKNISYIASVSLLMTLLLFLTNPINHGIFLYHTIILDSLTDFFKIIIIVATLFSLLVSVQYLQRQGLNYFEFLLFIILSASSMLFLFVGSRFYFNVFGDRTPKFGFLHNGSIEARFRIFYGGWIKIFYSRGLLFWFARFWLFSDLWVYWHR